MLSTRVKIDFMIAGADVMFALVAAASGSLSFILFVGLALLMYKIGEYTYEQDQNSKEPK